MNKPFRALLALIPMLALACSAEDNGEPEMFSTVVETGESRQAVSFVYGQFHGLVSNDYNTRCNHLQKNYSETSPCIFPPRRDLKFKAVSGGSAQEKTEVLAGLNLIKGVANGLGWAISTNQSTGVATNITCNTLPAGVLGQTNTVVVFNSGELRRWETASITIDVCRIATYAASVGLFYTDVIRNVAKHEMMHSLGFGHRGGPASTPCHDRLMFSSYQPQCSIPGLHSEETFALDVFEVN
jgi:hypothetical protein